MTGYFQLRKPYTLDYFKYWENGIALLNHVTKELELGDIYPEKKKEGFIVYVEGTAKHEGIPYIVLSDAFNETESFSNKHHYLIEKEFFNKQFEKTKKASKI